MSGFAGIINPDGAPVDPRLLDRMSRAAERHGSGAFNTRCEANAGLGHSLLRTTFESAAEEQPLSLDGSRWIVGDVRLDDRDGLVSALRQRGRQVTLSQPDIVLVLNGFLAWGHDCVDHFIGDFAFAVWDENQQSLFCARDTFGVKPFYHASIGGSFLFSNDLNAIRACPEVTSELNEGAIADFLAFGYNLDESATCFSDIRRLAPSHTLALSHTNIPGIRRYQMLNFARDIRYRDAEAYPRHFLELFRQAVKDRLRTDRVSFELSGGLDSTSVASIAALLNGDNPDFRGKAVTTTIPQSGPDSEESRYAALVAERHGLEHETIETGAKEDFYAYRDTSQPYAWPFAAATIRFGRRVRDHGPVMLTGQGSDAVLQGSGFDLLDDYRESSLAVFAMKTITAGIRKRSVRGLGLRSLSSAAAPRLKLPKIPEWLKSDFLRKAGSIERWKDLFYDPDRFPPGCRSEMAYDALRMPFWSHLFEDYYHDLLSGIDCRHPFFDLRVIEFLLAIPPSLKRDKHLLRDALESLLPEPVRLREKSVLVGDPVQVRIADEATLGSLEMSLEICAPWIDKAAYLRALESYARGGDCDLFTILCPLSLAKWTGPGLVV